jgi:hypothetical protein
MRRRLGHSEGNIIIVQGNLANTYQLLRRFDEALRMRQELYSRCLQLFGEHEKTLIAANNLVGLLIDLKRFNETRAVLRKTVPAARRVLGDHYLLTLMIRGQNERAVYEDDSATIDDLHKSVKALEDLARTARRVLGGAHPFVLGIEGDLLPGARAALARRNLGARTASRTR